MSTISVNSKLLSRELHFLHKSRLFIQERKFIKEIREKWQESNRTYKRIARGSRNGTSATVKIKYEDLLNVPFMCF